MTKIWRLTLIQYCYLIYRPDSHFANSPKSLAKENLDHAPNFIVTALSSPFIFNISSVFVFNDTDMLEECEPVILQNIPHLAFVWCFSWLDSHYPLVLGKPQSEAFFMVMIVLKQKSIKYTDDCLAMKQ